MTTPHVIGRYALFDPIAVGGMGTVHFGRLMGSHGFSRTVALKRLHPHFAVDPDFVAMLLDEARLTSRINHPNVVHTSDVVAIEGEIVVVMEYIHGDTLSHLVRRAGQEGLPLDVACAILIDVLHGLHAAHEAKDETGKALAIIHRDVSPQNILVGVDGVARVVDFGIAKAAARIQTTRDGQMKGKLGYMAPEQLKQEEVDRRVDVYACGVVLWEALAGRRLFDGNNDGRQLTKILFEPIPPVSRVRGGVPAALDDIVTRALSRAPDERFATAQDMANALEETGLAGTRGVVSTFVRRSADELLADRASKISAIEATPIHETSPKSSAIEATPIREPSPKRRPWAAIAGVAIVGATGAVAFFFLGHRAPPRVASASSAVSSAGPPPAHSIAEAPTAVASPPTTGAAQPVDSIAPKRVREPRGGAVARPPSSTPTPCATVTIDSAGIKHLHPECM